MRSRQAGGGDAASSRSARPAGRSNEVHWRCGCRLRDLDAEQPGRAADVAQRLERREVELLGERLEVDAREAGHRAHELLEPRQLGVELLEHALLAVLDLVLRLARCAAPRAGRARTGTGARSASRGCRRRSAGWSGRGRARRRRCCSTSRRGRRPRDRGSFIATSASKKSQMPRGCRPSSAPSSRRGEPARSQVREQPNSTAVRSTLEDQKENAVWRIGATSGCAMRRMLADNDPRAQASNPARAYEPSEGSDACAARARRRILPECEWGSER